jgi:hypothetical protein
MRSFITALLAAASLAGTASAQRYNELVDPSPERPGLHEIVQVCKILVEQRIAQARTAGQSLRINGRTVIESEYRPAAMRDCVTALLQKPLTPKLEVA